jgi:hypothetical protein
MSGRDPIGAERARMIEERAELDLAVAENVGIRRASRLVFAQEVREDALAILGGEVHRFELDSDDVGDRRGVDQIGARGAVLVGVVVLPVLHEEADDVEALLLEQPRGDRRIDAPDMPTTTRPCSPSHFRDVFERAPRPGAVVVDAAHDERAAMRRASSRELVVREPERAEDAGIERARRLVRDDLAANAKRMNVAPVSAACHRIDADERGRRDPMAGLLERLAHGRGDERFACLEVAGRLIETYADARLLLDEQERVVAHHDGGDRYDGPRKQSSRAFPDACRDCTAERQKRQKAHASAFAFERYRVASWGRTAWPAVGVVWRWARWRSEPFPAAFLSAGHLVRLSLRHPVVFVSPAAFIVGCLLLRRRGFLSAFFFAAFASLSPSSSRPAPSLSASSCLPPPCRVGLRHGALPAPPSRPSSFFLLHLALGGRCGRGVGAGVGVWAEATAANAPAINATISLFICIPSRVGLVLLDHGFFW